MEDEPPNDREEAPLSGEDLAEIAIASSVAAAPDAATAVRTWLETRIAKKPNLTRSPDLAHEPVILIRPTDRLGEVVWDPQLAPPAKQATSKMRRRPVGLAPP